MIIRFKKNGQTAYYDSENIGVAEPIPPPKCPFPSCGACSYPAIGFVCFNAEGDCLKTRIEKIREREKVKRCLQ